MLGSQRTVKHCKHGGKNGCCDSQARDYVKGHTRHMKRKENRSWRKDWQV